MTGFTAITSWQPVLTDHMSVTLEELAVQAGVRIKHVVAAREDRSRQEQGWRRSSSQMIVLPTRGTSAFVSELLRSEPRALHVFGSPFTEKRVARAFFRALWGGYRVCLVSEPYMTRAVGYLDDDAWAAAARAAARPLLYRGYGLLMRRRIDMVFAISPLALQQYRSAGVPAERLVPFGYFVADTGARRRPCLSPAPQPGTELTVAFMGGMIERKGLQPLLDAVQSLRVRGVRIRLDVHGPGDPSRYRFDGVGTRYCGRVPFGQAQGVIAEYDVLAVPSLHDGWGVVVNEALLAGVPVVCSAATGAGAVVRKWGCGLVVDTPDVGSLASALESIATDQAMLAEMGRRAEEAREVLQPSVAARYMLQCLESAHHTEQRPPCPWYDA